MKTWWCVVCGLKTEASACPTRCSRCGAEAVWRCPCCGTERTRIFALIPDAAILQNGFRRGRPRRPTS